ncbi:MAG: hypothetical protein K2N05_10690 [Muribaculaceae bacterium]|nr:hypothetical protein [Muribaculaceae bacterium]
MRKIFFILLSLGLALCSYAQTEQQAAMERIRADKGYRWGEARSASYDEAREKAREDLISKMKTVIVSESKMENDEFSNKTSALTIGNIENLSEIYYKEGSDYICMVYVSAADMRRAEEERMETIKEFIDLGKTQEANLNISEALKYYVWALRMLNLYEDNVKIATDGGERMAKTWLSNHIPAMLSSITINIPEEKIVEDPDSYDRYLVNIEAKYNGQPVSMLDLSYFNGQKMISPVHCKSGEGVFAFHDLDAIKNISARILYDYAQEGRNYSPTVSSVYPKGFERLSFDDRAALNLPLNVKKDKTKKSESVAEVTDAPVEASDANAVADAAPVVKAPVTTIARPFEKDATKYNDMMRRVEEAIRNKSYLSVKDAFTPEGFKLFEIMMGSGSVTVAKKDIEFTVEKSGRFIVGKSIPVAVKTGNHVSRENIVFRFDETEGKISSVAYALSQRAESDIFKEASWSMDSRYALLQFMEDYQTAFALKRLEYIASIFSDDAMIITGSVKPQAKKRFYKAGEIKGASFEKQVKYTKFDKDTYIQKLKEDFRRKSFIQLVFEDTYISKAAVPEGLIDNEVIWIELNQKYESSNYSDRGYLALQINLRPVGSEINVRTWTPYFIPMKDLKKAFPIGGN